MTEAAHPTVALKGAAFLHLLADTHALDALWDGPVGRSHRRNGRAPVPTNDPLQVAGRI